MHEAVSAYSVSSVTERYRVDKKVNTDCTEKNEKKNFLELEMVKVMVEK